MIRLMN